jgi:hypothetical protein
MIVLRTLGTYLQVCTCATLGRGGIDAGGLTAWRRGQIARGGGAKETLTLDAPSGRNP